MSGTSVEMALKERICVLTLNQPEKLNAMSKEMARDFRAVIEKIKNDPEPRVVVVTGAGRAFSAGANLDMMTAMLEASPVENKKFVFDFYNTFLSIMDLKIPTIAAINGHAIGAGAGLILACDMRIAANNCKIGFPFARMALHPGMGAEYFLTRVVGRAKAFEILMTGEPISSEEAYRIGLLNHITAPEDVMKRTMDLAKKIAAVPVLPIRMLKESIDAAMNGTLTDALHREAAYQSLCFMSDDMREGIKAIKEKRPPEFKDEY